MKFLRSLILLGLWGSFVILITPWGCGGGSTSSSTADVSESDAQDAASASANVALELFEQGAADLSLPPAVTDAGLNAWSLTPEPEPAITATATTSCSEGTLPTLTNPTIRTISGSTFDADGTGSCSLAIASSDNLIEAVAECDLFSSSETTGVFTIDGDIGASVSFAETGSSQYTIATEVSSNDLQFYFHDSSNATRVCDVVLNLMDVGVVTVEESSVTYTRNMSGCISFCDEAYSVSGSTSGTLQTE